MTRCGGVFSASWMRASTSRRRSSAAVSRSSARARALARLGQRLDRGGRRLVAARPAGSRPPAAGRRRPCAALSASESCDSSARRRASISSGASASASRSARASARRSPSEAICRSAFSARAVQLRALGGDRGQAARARLGLALQPFMDGARVGQRRAVARDVAGQRGRAAACRSPRSGARGKLRFGLGEGGRRLGMARRRGARAPRRAPRAGSTARRPPSRPAASASRASPSACCASRQACRAARSASIAFAQRALRHAASACFGRAQLLGRRDRFGIELGQPVLLRQPLRGGGRRVGAGGQAVPAPQRAFAADQPLAGRKQRLQPRAVGGVDDADLRQPAGELRAARARRWPGCATPSGSAGSPGCGLAVAPMRRRAAVERRRRDLRRVRRPAPSRSRARP